MQEGERSIRKINPEYGQASLAIKDIEDVYKRESKI
jgi:hypothetical protein